MLGLVRSVICGFFDRSAKKVGVNNFVFYLLIAVAGATLYQVGSQSHMLQEMRENNAKLATVAEQRLVLVNELKESVTSLNEAMKEQNKIAVAQIEFEKALREKQGEKIETIRQLLKSNQCARDTIPKSLVERLRTQ